MKKFRPIAVPKLYKIRERLQTGRVSNYNWQTRTMWYPAGWSQHKIGIVRRFSQLHYLASHAPTAVRSRWTSAHTAYVSRYRRLL
jgi:hypothetical protein